MKEKIIFSISIAVILIALMFLTTLPPKNADTIKFDTVLIGEYSGISEKDIFVINTKEEWNTFIGKIKNDPEYNENIDFDEKYTFIAVTMGENQTKGYSIEIKEVYEFKDYVKLYIIQEIPCAGCDYETKITRPFHIIKIAKTYKTICR